MKKKQSDLEKFRSDGGKKKWDSLTEEQRKTHIKKMTDNSLETRRKIRDENLKRIKSQSLIK